MVLNVYRFQKRAFVLIRSMELMSVSTQLSHWQNKTKTNKMVLSTEDLVLIKVLRQEKGYDNWWIITLLHWR